MLAYRMDKDKSKTFLPLLWYWEITRLKMEKSVVSNRRSSFLDDAFSCLSYFRPYDSGSEYPCCSQTVLAIWRSNIVGVVLTSCFICPPSMTVTLDAITAMCVPAKVGEWFVCSDVVAEPTGGVTGRKRQKGKERAKGKFRAKSKKKLSIGESVDHKQQNCVKQMTRREETREAENRERERKRERK